jgi:hypothetical protein
LAAIEEEHREQHSRIAEAAWGKKRIFAARTDEEQELEEGEEEHHRKSYGKHEAS